MSSLECGGLLSAPVHCCLLQCALSSFTSILTASSLIKEKLIVPENTHTPAVEVFLI